MLLHLENKHARKKVYHSVLIDGHIKARWEGKHPPKPAFWMHQLGRRNPHAKAPYLEAKGFARALGGIL